MDDDGGLWRIEIRVPGRVAQGFEDAIEPCCEVLSRFIDGDGPNWRIEGFSRNPPDRPALNLALEIVATALQADVPVVHVSKVPPRDWLVENLKDFPPFDIGRFFIYGSHYEGVVPSGKTGLQIDAGAAFGTGRHESTEGCLQAIDELARQRRFVNPLDMGCGSGILSLALAKRAGVRVTASDVDARAVGITAVNARLNGVGFRVRALRSNGYRSTKIAKAGPFDLIVANILANPLSAMAGDLVRNLAPGGHAILSGFIERDSNRVFAAHRRLGLKMRRRITINGWRTLVLSR
ncbi:MAG: 50S ribosomal protein L11 methyltransferase [Rhodospirillales bacterium]|nr:50S ribosomal protein L11 methyltransferase [Rhodospirillales bacterium]